MKTENDAPERQVPNLLHPSSFILHPSSFPARGLMQIEEYRTQLVAFSTDLNREHYMYFAGHKEHLDLARIYDRYSDLYKLDMIADIRRWRGEASPLFPSVAQSLDKLLAFAAGQYLEMGTKELSERIAEEEGRAQIDWQGRKIGFYESFVVLANEPDPAQRRQLARRISEVIASLNDLRAERLEKQHGLCADLGYRSYLEAHTTLRSIDYTGLAQSMEA